MLHKWWLLFFICYWSENWQALDLAAPDERKDNCYTAGAAQSLSRSAKTWQSPGPRRRMFAGTWASHIGGTEWPQGCLPTWRGHFKSAMVAAEVVSPREGAAASMGSDTPAVTFGDVFSSPQREVDDWERRWVGGLGSTNTGLFTLVGLPGMPGPGRRWCSAHALHQWDVFCKLIINRLHFLS